MLHQCPRLHQAEGTIGASLSHIHDTQIGNKHAELLCSQVQTSAISIPELHRSEATCHFLFSSSHAKQLQDMEKHCIALVLREAAEVLRHLKEQACSRVLLAKLTCAAAMPR